MDRLRFSVEKSTKDIQRYLQRDFLRGITRTIMKASRCESYRKLCTKVYITFIELAMEDVIDKGIAFSLPIGRKAKIYVVKTFNKKKETDYNVFDDPIKYLPVISFLNKKNQINLYITLSKEMQDRIDYNAFNGVAYFESILKL